MDSVYLYDIELLLCTVTRFLLSIPLYFYDLSHTYTITP